MTNQGQVTIYDEPSFGQFLDRLDREFESFNDYLAAQLRDPEFKAVWDALGKEYERVADLIRRGVPVAGQFISVDGGTQQSE